MTNIHEKHSALRHILEEMDAVLVAFSGGVDSSLLLRVAAEVLGERCTALTTVSMAVPEHDQATARRLATALGVRHLVVQTNELALADYIRNPVNRCYFCKDNLFRICRERAAHLRIPYIVDGANADDLRDHRPGFAAAAKAGVRHPLIEVGLGKDEIRALSGALGLETWNRPASPCLSSRIPYGTPITQERLTQIAAAERFLRNHGFRDLRVRHHDGIARLEVPIEDLPRILEPTLRGAIVNHLRALGFAYITVDLAGFRSGSLNTGLAASEPPQPAATSARSSRSA